MSPFTGKKSWNFICLFLFQSFLTPYTLVLIVLSLDSLDEHCPLYGVHYKALNNLPMEFQENNLNSTVLPQYALLISGGIVSQDQEETLQTKLHFLTQPIQYHQFQSDFQRDLKKKRNLLVSS